MSDKQENYNGDYKIGISDKGRISFNLNVKWAIAIAFSIITFVGYLLLDEYYIEPTEEKLKRLEILEAADKSKDQTLENIQKDIGTLLEQGENTQKFIEEYKESHSTHFDHSPELPNNHQTPGH